MVQVINKLILVDIENLMFFVLKILMMRVLAIVQKI